MFQSNILFAAADVVSNVNNLLWLILVWLFQLIFIKRKFMGQLHKFA